MQFIRLLYSRILIYICKKANRLTLVNLAFRTRLKSSSNGGFTLIDVVMATVLGGILALILGAISLSMMSSMHSSNLEISRNEAVATVRKLASDLKALRVTLNQIENVPLSDCVCGSTSGCQSLQAYALNLYDSSGSPLENPAYFNSQGIPCKGTEGDCLIKVSTTFMAECLPTLPSANPVPPKSCVIPAEFIQVIYLVEQNPNVPTSGLYFRSVHGGVFTQVSTLVGNSGVCTL